MWWVLLAVTLGHVTSLEFQVTTSSVTSAMTTHLVKSYLPHRTLEPTGKPARTTLTMTSPTRTTKTTELASTTQSTTQSLPPQIIQFPDSVGILHDVNLAAEPDRKLLSNIAKYPYSNLHLLFTRSNYHKAQVLIMNNAASITESHFRKMATTYVVVHGWLNDKSSEINIRIKNALLDSFDVNVIVLDWSRLSHADYVTATLGVPTIGRGLGEFLNFLSSVAGDDVSNFYLIGHSLGAHLVGNAGRTLGGKVGRITVLDPAKPLWQYNPDAIAEQDALYVEAIHTDGKKYGLFSKVGHVDFYVNGGECQPGCVTNSCSHQRSWKLFVVSLTSYFVGFECETEVDAVVNNCNGKEFPMGNADVTKRGSGIYRVNTKSRFPYI